jgi:type VI protein secretion system component VasK
MARNRRAQSAEVRFGPALKALLICLLLGGAAVGYVCQRNQLDELGRQKKQREQQLYELRLRNAQRARQVAELLSPINLERRARSLDLGLGLPHPTQVIVISDQVIQPARPVPDLHLARHPAGDEPGP